MESSSVLRGEAGQHQVGLKARLADDCAETIVRELKGVIVPWNGSAVSSSSSPPSSAPGTCADGCCRMLSCQVNPPVVGPVHTIVRAELRDARTSRLVRPPDTRQMAHGCELPLSGDQADPAPSGGSAGESRSHRIRQRMSRRTAPGIHHAIVSSVGRIQLPTLVRDPGREPLLGW